MKKYKHESFWRINVLFFAAVLGFLAIFARLFFLQIVKFSYYKAAAEEQHRMFKKILPERGKIFISDKNKENFFPVAINKKIFLFYAVPKEIEDRSKFIEEVSAFIKEEMEQNNKEQDEAIGRISSDKKNAEEFSNSGGESDNLENRENDSYLAKAKELLENKLRDMNDPYEVILEKASEDLADKIKKAGIKGAYFSADYARFYPEHEFAADILGFVGFQGDVRSGRYGIEEFFNSELEGRPGSILGEKDTKGRWVSIKNKEVNPAKNGCDIYLAIDRNIQFKAEEILKESSSGFNIDSGSIIVADPRTGEILAMADWPTFNSNYYGKFSDLEVFQNGAIQKVYEPGSVFKVLTMSAAMNEGKISPLTKYEDKGFAAIRDRIIRNVDRKSFGAQTMTEVLEKSLNTGAIFAQQSIPEGVFLNYLKNYHFGKILGIELSGEVSGSIRALEDIPINPVNYAAVSFGQGISVTALEMLSAVSAIANKGILMRPRIVSKISNNENDYIKISEEIGRVISPETALKISAMMVSVVKNGSGSAAAVPGYKIAGKTGTAQIPENGVYTNKSVHSFVGFGPLENPAFAILIKFDNPKGVRFSSATAAPAFGKLAKFILEYYSIPPE